MKKPAVLLLEDGTLFNGFSFGHDGEAAGEICLNTAMTGYQEIITDPEFAGQIVAFTYPLLGAYGANSADVKSPVKVRGIVAREYSAAYENWRAEFSLEKFLTKHKIAGIEGVDTRKLTRHLRGKEKMRCIISGVDTDKKSLLAKIQAAKK